MRIDNNLNVSGQGEDKNYSAADVIAILEGGGGGGGGGSGRTLMPTTYSTSSDAPTVYYTALHTNLSVLTARTTSGVQLLGSGLYLYQQPCTGVTEYIAVWDEGDATDYTQEYVVVDE